MHLIGRYVSAILVLGLTHFLTACWQDNPYEYSDNTAPIMLEVEDPIAVEPISIYCSCGPTTDKLSSVPDSAGQIVGLDGVLVRVAWRDIEPEPGVYHWELIDDQLEKATTENLLINIAILNGPSSPHWLLDQGAEVFEFTPFNATETRELPLPWDSVYIDAYTSFISEFGNRYNGNPRINIVHATNSTTNGFEMQYALREDDQIRFREAGYSEEAVINSWKTVLDSYSFSFPSTRVDVEVHPVMGNTDVAYQVVNYGINLMGNRFGVLATWWSTHNASVTYPEMYSLVADVSLRTFSTVQLVSATTNDVSVLNPLTYEEFIGSLKLAVSSGVSVIEIWESDIKNEDLMKDVKNIELGDQNHGIRDF